MKKRAFISAILVALTLQVAAVPAVFTASAVELDQSLVALQQSAELSADKVSLGGSVTVTAEVKDNCTYAMYYSLNGGQSWKTAKAYSEENTAVIKASVAGKYDVCVKTKDAQGAVTKEYLSFDSVDDLELSTSISADKVVLGDTITVSAEASGGNGGYKYYAYWKPQANTSWKNIIKDGESCDFNLSPSVAGNYDVCIKVKDQTGIVKKESLSFEVVDYNVELQLKSSQISLGQKETITASVDDESGEYTYKFYFKKSDSNVWRVVQDFDSNNRVVVLPKEVGEYDVCVKTKNKAGNVRKSYTKFNVNEKLVASHTLSRDMIAKGESITVTPSSTGGTGTVKYAVYYTTKEKYEAGEIPWEIALAFDQEGEAVITPEEDGEYVVITKAMDEAGCVSKTEYTHFNVIDVEPLSVTCKFNGSPKVYTDSYAQLTAQASGGVGPYTYELMIKTRDSDEWGVLYNYSTENVFKIYRSAVGNKLGIGASVLCDLKVIAKDSLGNTSEVLSTVTIYNREEYELPFIPY